MYKTLGFNWLIEIFCSASAFVPAEMDEARNPARFIPPPSDCAKTNLSL